MSGYGRRRYKGDFIKFLVYATASCDELKGQIRMISKLYPDILEFQELLEPYQKLSNELPRRKQRGIRWKAFLAPRGGELNPRPPAGGLKSIIISSM